MQTQYEKKWDEFNVYHNNRYSTMIATIQDYADAVKKLMNDRVAQEYDKIQKDYERNYTDEDGDTERLYAESELARISNAHAGLLNRVDKITEPSVESMTKLFMDQQQAMLNQYTDVMNAKASSTSIQDLMVRNEGEQIKLWDDIKAHQDEGLTKLVEYLVPSPKPSKIQNITPQSDVSAQVNALHAEYIALLQTIHADYMAKLTTLLGQ